MFHNDVQIQVTNNWKRNNNEHPIDRILTGYFNTNNQMKNSQTNIRPNNYKSETNHIIQRQRVIRSFLNKPDENEPSIRKPTTLGTTPKSLFITSFSTPQLLYTELNEPSTNNNNRQQTMKKDLDHQSSILTRRQRPTIENLSSIHQVSDITNLSGNQLSIAIPPNFAFRNKPSRVPLSDRPSFKIDEQISSPRTKPLNYSKTISENNLKQNTYIPKLIHQNTSHPTHTWTPRLSEQGSIHTRTLTTALHAKSQLSKYFKNHQRQSQSEKINTYNPKTNYIQDLYISPQTLVNPHPEYDMNKKIHKTRFILDEWGDSKSNHDVISDEDESVNTDGNSSTSTCNSQVSLSQYDHSSSLSTQHDLFSSPDSFLDNSKSKLQRSSIKRHISRRRAYNLALTPVAEYLDDEETDMKKIFEKSSALQNNDINEKKFDLSIDDENSLTFQLLNQQETEFEKKLSKSRKFPFNQK